MMGYNACDLCGRPYQSCNCVIETQQPYEAAYKDLRTKYDELQAEVERLKNQGQGVRATAERCAEICLKQNTVRMAADAIRKEFGIGGE